MLVAVEVIGNRVVCDDQIEPAVVVDIDKHRSKTIAALCVGNACFDAYIGESAVAVVVNR